jgi:hypothetical protein
MAAEVAQRNTLIGRGRQLKIRRLVPAGARTALLEPLKLSGLVLIHGSPRIVNS